jgi:hypothetical protein
LQLIDEPIAHLNSRAKKADAFFKTSTSLWKLTVFLLQLTDSLMLSRQRFANAWLALLRGLVLFHPATDRGNTNVHHLADVRNAEALFCDHSNDLKLEARVKIAALPGHVNSFEGELSTYRGIRGH